jgi:hypothetical protein
MTIASATIANVQRIQPYRVAKKKVILTAQNAPVIRAACSKPVWLLFWLSSGLHWRAG